MFSLLRYPLPFALPPSNCAGAYHGDSDLQLERINVYFNEATGGRYVRVQLSESCVSARIVLLSPR